MDQGLVGLGLLGGHAAELAEKFWGDTDGDELFGVAGGGTADSASAAEFAGGRFRDYGARPFLVNMNPVRSLAPDK